MRNYRELTTEEVDRLRELYPVTPNRELAIIFDISLDSIIDHFAVPLGWKKDRKAVLVGNRGGRSLTDKEVQWIVRHYHNTRNADILQKYGIGESTLHRIARKYKLSKTKQFMRKMQRENSDMARMVGKQYGLYEELAEQMRRKLIAYRERGEYKPGSFLPGIGNKDRMTKRQRKAAMVKIHIKRNNTIKSERRRARWGMEGRTKMNIKAYGYSKIDHTKSVHRTLFRRKGYIIGRGSNIVYYDEETQRNAKMEANAHRYGLTIKDYNE